MKTKCMNIEFIPIYYGECKSGNRCVPTIQVNDPEKKSIAIKLLNNLITLLEKWKIYDTSWIKYVYDNELEKISIANVTGSIADSIIKLSKEIRNYIENTLMQYWVTYISNDIKKLIDDIKNGRTIVIMEDTGNSLTLRIYGKYTELFAEKIYKSNSTVFHIIFNELSPLYINTFDILVNIIDKNEYKTIEEKILIPLRLGWAITDESVTSTNKPSLRTHQLWQLLLWSLLYPGTIRIKIDGIAVTENELSIRWKLNPTSSDYISLKGMVADIVPKFNDTMFWLFLFAIILGGDGNVSIYQTSSGDMKLLIEISISPIKFNILWKPLILKKLDQYKNKLGLYYAVEDKGYKIRVRFAGHNAIIIARQIISSLPPLLRTLLAIIGFEKWNKMLQIANFKLNHYKGQLKLTIKGVTFSMSISNSGAELYIRVRDEAEANKLIEYLKTIFGENLDVRKRTYRDFTRIVIPWAEITRRAIFRRSVITKLRELLVNDEINDKRKKDFLTVLNKLIKIDSSDSIGLSI